MASPSRSGLQSALPCFCYLSFG